MRAVLTIAGSDSSAGAGIQADLKTFAALGVYGTSAVTAVTSQNPSGVDDVFALPPQVVRSQIECIARDMSLSAIKAGMLATAEIVTVVAETIGHLRRPNLVVDPVMVASGAGRRTLLTPEAVSVLRTLLLPLAVVVEHRRGLPRSAVWRSSPSTHRSGGREEDFRFGAGRSGRQGRTPHGTSASTFCMTGERSRFSTPRSANPFRWAVPSRRLAATCAATSARRGSAQDLCHRRH